MKRLKLLSVALTTLAALLIITQPAFAREPTKDEQDALNSTIELLTGMSSIGDPLSLGDIDYSRIEIGDVVPAYAHYADGEIRQTNEYFPLYYDGRCIGACLKQLDGSMGFRTGIGKMIQEYFDETGADGVALLYDADGMHFTDGERITYIAPQSDPGRAAIELSNEPISADRLGSLEIGHPAAALDSQPNEVDSATSDASQQASSQTRTFEGNYCPMTYVWKPLGSKICWAACMSMLYGYHGYSYPSAVSVAQYYGTTLYEIQVAHIK